MQVQKVRDPGFRRDIQGLRAIAVLFVTLYHIWPKFLPGGYVGVDIFFVISGYLITAHLAKELSGSGTISLTRFYARRIRRLLPAATFTLLLVAILAPILLPETQWRESAIQIAASALYAENWWLVRQAVDYVAMDEAASPVQHYWSLSVEEQFYIFWPVVMLLGGGLATFCNFDRRKTLTGLLIGISVASLLLSIHFTGTRPAQAYFYTFTRIWELGLGGLLALLVHMGIDLSGVRLKELMGTLGLLGVALAGWLIDEDSAFPGYIALLPTASAALMLAAGTGNPVPRSLAWMSWKPVQYIGDLSYSLYLVHWLVVVFFQAKFGMHPGFAMGALMFIVSVVGAHAIKRTVEDPFRFAPLGNRRDLAPYVVGTACIVTCVAASTMQLGYLQYLRKSFYINFRVSDYPGARVLAANFGPLPEVPPAPRPAVASIDFEEIHKKGCNAPYARTVLYSCEFGNKNAAVHVALLGDSHSAQWLPALQEIAAKKDWSITTYTKASCPFSAASVVKPQKLGGARYSECDAWNQQLLRRIKELKPSVVFTSMMAARTAYGALDEAQSNQWISNGLKTYWKELADAGIRVVALRDTPQMGSDMPTCVARHVAEKSACGVPRRAALVAVDPQVAASADNPDVKLVDLNNYVCGKQTCEAVIGNVLVYRDAHHFTATFSKSLADALDARLQEDAAINDSSHQRFKRAADKGVDR